MTTTRSGVPALVAATACWGSVVVTIKIAARGLPILTITMIEVLIAVVLLGGLLALRATAPVRPTRGLVLAGVLEPGLAYPLINAGLARTSGTHAAVIIGLESVLVVAGAAAWERVRPSLRIALAVLVTALGAALVTGGDGGSATVAGDALVGAGVITAAVYVLVAQRQVGDALTTTFYQFLFGTLTVLALSLPAVVSGTPVWGHPSGGELAATAATGVVGSAVAFLLYNWALGRVPTALAATSLTLIPVFGIAFAALFLDERVGLRVLVGGLIVIAGLVAVRSPGGARAPAGVPDAGIPDTGGLDTGGLDTDWPADVSR